MSDMYPEQPKVSAFYAALTRTVGAGLAATMADGDAQAEVRISLPSSVSSPWSAADSMVLAGAFGEIEFADGIRFFRAISGIDIGMGGEEQRQWLSAAALGRLGGTPFAPADRLGAGPAAGSGDAVTLRVGLRTPLHAFTVNARADVVTWLNFLRRSDWSPERSPAAGYAELPVVWPVMVASHSMNLALLKSIAVGDTILPQRTFFDCGGTGSIDIMGLQLLVRYRGFNRVEIVALEGGMDIESDEGHEDDEGHGNDEGHGDAEGHEEAAVADDVPAPHGLEEETAGAAGAAVSPAQLAGLDRLPVKVDFELGHLQLSLAQLRTIGPGVLLQIEGASSPASVAVTSAGRLLGRGEIVDVNGQLGIRIVDWGGGC